MEEKGTEAYAPGAGVVVVVGSIRRAVIVALLCGTNTRAAAAFGVRGIARGVRSAALGGSAGATVAMQNRATPQIEVLLFIGSLIAEEL